MQHGMRIENLQSAHQQDCEAQDVQPMRQPHPHSVRSEEHTSELQSRENLVCRLLLEKKKPRCSRSTWRSASAWHGCSASESALMTGIDAASASPSTMSCPNTRATIAST